MSDIPVKSGSRTVGTNAAAPGPLAASGLVLDLEAPELVDTGNRRAQGFLLTENNEIPKMAGFFYSTRIAVHFIYIYI